MPLPHFGGGPKWVLNEEKYMNEKRRLILGNIFNDDENPIDFKKLENMEKDFLEVLKINWEPKYF